MKKRTAIKLSLNKKSVSDLNKAVIQGGLFSEGCSDGCTPLQTALFCTNANCTGDCGGGTNFPYCRFDDY
ncbi:hypothetical protein KORDIASMS9_01787 [Kordia sp. SMS9]|uniref:hypothetical protein n=1 Tax=Kordia sp. SMS9 TaxID=2282170 RepID=UPI000E0D1044|nr:hypothetical protein [Kordia sp. SMS9]AXG69564.1 hypothetical protein KORDIASMS9_01787 [Kordia sp. SMS9]